MNALSLVEKIACLPSQDKAQVEWLVDRFLAHSLPRKGCDCHVVDPRKQSIVIWPSRNPKHADDLIVKFIDQRLVALPRIDKRGEKYWKVRDFYENEEREPEIGSNSPPVSQEVKPEMNKPLSMYSKAELDRLAKFQARQAQAQPKEEPKSMSGEEYLAHLAREKAEKQTQAPENAPNQGKENEQSTNNHS